MDPLYASLNGSHHFGLSATEEYLYLKPPLPQENIPPTLTFSNFTYLRTLSARTKKVNLPTKKVRTVCNK